MANHGYVTTEQSISYQRLVEMIHEINRDRFDGALPVDVGKEIVLIANQRQIWLESPHVIEIRHGGGGDILWWIDSVFTNDLALKVDGVITDDGHGGKTKGEPGKYATLLEYIESYVQAAPVEARAFLVYHHVEFQKELAHDDELFSKFIPDIPKPEGYDEFVAARQKAWEEIRKSNEKRKESQK